MASIALAVTAIVTPVAQPAAAHENVPQETCSLGWDFGDAPRSYRTTVAKNGPRHSLIGLDRLTIGTQVDDESDGMPGPDADGDRDDARPAGPVRRERPTLTVPVRNLTGFPAILAGWIDFDDDGEFELVERATVAVAANADSARLRWKGRASNKRAESVFIRLRLYPGPLLARKLGRSAARHLVVWPTGPAIGGEVEDHRIRWVRPKPTPPPTPSPTLSTSPTLPPSTPPPSPVEPSPEPPVEPTREPSPEAAVPATTRPPTPVAPTESGQPTPKTVEPEPTRRRKAAPAAVPRHPPRHPPSQRPGSAEAPTEIEGRKSGRLPITFTVFLALLVPAIIVAARGVARARH